VPLPHPHRHRERERERERGFAEAIFCVRKNFFFFFLISFQKIVYDKAGLLNKEEVFLINYNWLDI
jgi:hypothetical protein